MAMKEIPKDRWEDYFNEFTNRFLKDENPEFTRIEVLTAETGLQVETEAKRLLGIVYDPKEDAIELHFPELTHRVFNPKVVVADERPDGFIQSLKVLVERFDFRMGKGREEVITLAQTAGYGQERQQTA